MRFLTLAGLLLLSAVTASADVTGRWEGTITLKRGEETRNMPALVILKQDGVQVTGTGGPDDNERHPIERGKLENGKLTFEIPNNKMVFDLEAKDDTIEGTIQRGEQTAKISLKRVK